MERSKFTKAHIISHILAVRGPSTRDELLRECARIEGKVYKSTSNGSYFRTVERCTSGFADVARARRASLVANGTIKVVAHRGRTPVYDLDARGFALAAEYLSA